MSRLLTDLQEDCERWAPARQPMGDRLHGFEVVVATNGVPLTWPGIARRLVELGVDGVSVARQRGRGHQRPAAALPVRPGRPP